MTQSRRSGTLLFTRTLNGLTLLLAVWLLLILFKVLPNPIADAQPGVREENRPGGAAGVERPPPPPGLRKNPMLGEKRGLYESSLQEPELLSFYRSWFEKRGWRGEATREEEMNRGKAMRFLVYSKRNRLGVVGVESLTARSGSAVVVMNTQRIRPGDLSRSKRETEHE
ncbi:MAG: hypothetical protein ACYTGH_01630 [Planctomycetota bacterium]